MVDEVMMKAEFFRDERFGVAVRVEFRQNDGLLTSRTVDIATYLDILKDGCMVQKESLSLGKVPEYLYDATYSLENGKCVGLKAYFFVPERNVDMRYKNRKAGEETVYPAVRYPSLFFEVEIRGGSATGLRCWAVKGNVITGSTVLYRYPFGNSYGDGRICMGGYTIEANSVNDAAAYMQSFFLLSTNDDLYGADTNKSGKSQKDLYAELSGREHFLNDILLETRGRKLVSDIVSDTRQ